MNDTSLSTISCETAKMYLLFPTLASGRICLFSQDEFLKDVCVRTGAVVKIEHEPPQGKQPGYGLSPVYRSRLECIRHH